MRKYFIILGVVLGTVAVAPAQAPTPSPTPAALYSPALTPTPGTAVSPGPVSPDVTPVPTLTPPPRDNGAAEISALTNSSSFEWSTKGAPVFTLDKAVITALQQNPDVLRAQQEIERSKGVIIQVRAEALPRVNASADLTWTDPNL